MKLRLFGILLAAILVVASCENAEDPAQNNIGEPANVQFKLIDNPIQYDAVLIDIQGLEYKLDTADEDNEGEGNEEEEDDSSGRISDDDEGGWNVVEIEPMVYDLLELNNGAQALLAEVEVEAGELQGVRVILGSDNKVVVDGDTIDLTVPSGSKSGLKVKVKSDLEGGEDYEVVVDFDAQKSIVHTGSDKYLLKPVIRVSIINPEDELGGISGVVFPETLSSIVYAINEDEDSVSTIPESNGSYLIDMLEEDNYSVVAVPDETSEFSAITISPVEVLEGQITELDTIKFEE